MKIETNKGFTLIEMAIVLVIIGIILAGVMKGRDIVRGSQVKQFSQGFAQKWVTVASTYKDKTMQSLFDGLDNGGHTPTPDGLMDNRIMEPTITGFTDDVLAALQNVGITPCTMIKSDLEDWSTGTPRCSGDYNIYARTVEGEFSGRSKVVVGFHTYEIRTGAAGTTGPLRDTVSFVNVPTDVAIGLDTLVDGQANGEIGSCVCISSYGAEVNPPSVGGTGHSNTPGAPVNTQAWPTGLASGGDNFCTVLMVLDY